MTARPLPGKVSTVDRVVDTRPSVLEPRPESSRPWDLSETLEPAQGEGEGPEPRGTRVVHWKWNGTEQKTGVVFRLRASGRTSGPGRVGERRAGKRREVLKVPV